MWDGFGTVLGPFWDRFGTVFGTVFGNAFGTAFGTALGRPKSAKIVKQTCISLYFCKKVVPKGPKSTPFGKNMVGPIKGTHFLQKREEKHSFLKIFADFRNLSEQ